MTRVRLASDLAVGDEVRTPSGRLAEVKGFEEGAVLLLTACGDDLQLRPHLLTLVRKAPPHQVPQSFYRNAALAAGLGV